MNLTAIATITIAPAERSRCDSSNATAAVDGTSMKKSLWKPGIAYIRKIGLAATNTTANRGSRPSARAHCPTSPMNVRLISTVATFRIQ